MIVYISVNFAHKWKKSEAFIHFMMVSTFKDSYSKSSPLKFGLWEIQRSSRIKETRSSKVLYDFKEEDKEFWIEVKCTQVIKNASVKGLVIIGPNTLTSDWGQG